MAFGPVGDVEAVEPDGETALLRGAGGQRHVAQAGCALGKEPQLRTGRPEEHRLVRHVAAPVGAQAENLLVPGGRGRPVVDVEGDMVDADQSHGASVQRAFCLRDGFDPHRIDAGRRAVCTMLV
jgi:hypothetical protein